MPAGDLFTSPKSLKSSLISTSPQLTGWPKSTNQGVYDPNLYKQYVSNIYNPSKSQGFENWLYKYNMPNYNTLFDPVNTLEKTIQEAWKARSGRPGTTIYAARQGGL